MGKTLRYDDVFAAASGFPLVWEKDLKGWLREWGSSGVLEVVGLKPGKKVPQLRQAHQIRVLKAVH
jgi:hypothetical protein